jgi:hypothetical protein
VVSTGVMGKIIHNDCEAHPTKVCINYQGDEHIWMFKPILRPLSQLTEEINQDNQCFTPIDTLDMDFFNAVYLDSNKGLDLSKVSYLDVVRLLSWHFDVFGLIEQGLAVELK